MSGQPVYLSSYALEVYLNGVWTNITADTIQVISGSWGINGNGPADRVADTGMMRFTLENTSGKYSPNGPSALSGWKKGIKVRLTLTRLNKSKRWKGTIDDIALQSGAYERKLAFVTILDWIDYAAQTPIVNPGVQTNKFGDYVLTTLMGLMPIAPEATDFQTNMLNIFHTIFGTVTSKTRAYTEMTKVALSEIGYCYLIKDETYGETLVLENAFARHGWRTPTEQPVAYDVAGRLLKEDGGYLLKEDGGKIILNQVETFDIDNNMKDTEVVYGENLINRMTVNAFPQRVDFTPQILFQLSAPIQIGPGETVEVKGTYSDPNGGGTPINAQNMIAPVADTDYKFYSALAADITAALSISASYGSEGFTHQVTNTGSVSGSLTILNCRGYGIYTYNPIEHSATNLPSIDELGTQSESMDQKYKNTLLEGTLFTDSVVEIEKKPRTVLNKIYMIGNKSAAAMMAFLTLDVGDMVHVKEDQTGIDGNYYIQRVEFQLHPGGPEAAYLEYQWTLRESKSLQSGLSAVMVEIDNGSTQAINYNVNSYLTKKLFFANYAISVSAWVYPRSTGSTSARTVIAFFGDDDHRFHLEIDFANSRLNFFSTIAVWYANSSAITLDAWNHIVVTLAGNISSYTPIIYVNGASVGITYDGSGFVMALDLNTLPLYLGNTKTPTVNYAKPLQGLLFDVRVYNQVLSASDVTTLYNGGTPDTSLVTDGLQFQGPCVLTEDLATLDNAAMTSTDRVLDNIFSFVGRPNGTPSIHNKDYVVPIQVSVDAASTKIGNLVASISWSHTIGSGLNRLLVVAVSVRAFQTVSGVTLGASALTQLGAAQFSTGNAPRIELWYLVNPPSGAGTIAVNLTGSDFVEAIAVSYANVNQGNPFYTFQSNTGSSSPANITLASLNGDLVMDIVGLPGSATVGAGQTQQGNVSSDGTWRGASSTKVYNGSGSMQWTVAAVNWVIGAVSIRSILH